MTIEDAWDALDAAGEVARAHGYSCAPVITRQELRIELTRGADRWLVVVQVHQLDACADAGARRELVEREVARALRERTAIA